MRKTSIVEKAFVFANFAVIIIGIIIKEEHPAGLAITIIGCIGAALDLLDNFLFDAVPINIFFPKCILRHPYIMYIAVVLIGAISPISSRSFISLFSLLNIIVTPLVVFSYLHYIYKLDKLYKLLDTADDTKNAPISSMLLTLTFCYTIFSVSYYDPAILVDANFLIVISNWSNIIFQFISLYCIINCFVLSIQIFRKSKTYSGKLDYKHIFPFKTFYLSCIFILVWGISYIFSGHRLELSYELTWTVNLATFISLSYEIRLVPNVINTTFSRLKIPHQRVVIAMSMLVAIYGIVIRYFEAIKFSPQNENPQIDAVILPILFALICIVVLCHYLSFIKYNRKIAVQEEDNSES